MQDHTYRVSGSICALPRSCMKTLLSHILTFVPRTYSHLWSTQGARLASGHSQQLLLDDENQRLVVSAWADLGCHVLMCGEGECLNFLTIRRRGGQVHLVVIQGWPWADSFFLVFLFFFAWWLVMGALNNQVINC